MLRCFDFLRDITLISIFARLLLSVLCGVLIGIEREFKRRSAGFRTHILICLGAAMTTLTSEFLFLNMHYYLDISRIGAGVVSGIGFIGAGTIIVTRHQRVKGLTTAAGLWTAAIVGLAFGGGFYEGGIAATLLILLAELVFSRWEYRMLGRAPIINLYLEYQDRDCLETVLQEFKSRGIKVMNLEITRTDGEKNHGSCALFMLQLNKNIGTDTLLERLRGMRGVTRADEL